MFAIIKTGGKQYKVAANDIIRVEKLAGASGDTIEFKDVLMMGREGSVKIGAPLVTNARVLGTVLDQTRDDKVIIFKKKRRHNYRRKNGHRQYLTVVKITDILAEGESPRAKSSPAVAKEKAEKPAEKKTAAPKVETKVPAKKAAPQPEAKAPAKQAAPKAEKPSVKKAAPKAKKPSKK
ncbi:MAG: 50S ribosomal protein L21 [Alphaproteobacteria bacterium 41-28]|nr:MAG: 50S ribosomal protein L21 [Alphaproteobacteria bacterium 41-28]